MPTCPAGHTSGSSDFCDVCGMRIGDSASIPAATPTAGAPPEQAPAAPCPRCGTARSGRFCESCGFDFDAGEALGSAAAAGAVPGGDRGGAAEAGTAHSWFDPVPTSVDPGPATGGTPAVSAGPDPAAAGPDPAAAGPDPAAAGPDPAAAGPDPAVGPDPTAGPDPAAGGPAPIFADPGPAAAGPGPAADPALTSAGPDASAGPAPASGGPAPAPGGPLIWTAVAGSDREYFDAVVAAGGPDAASLAFPGYCPERRFRLAGPEMRIGRRSVSQGLEPEIDLTGPPTDPGVSRLHAVLMAEPDGSWVIIDPGSENGTMVNGNEVAAGERIALHDGDRIHLGAWTVITIFAG
jgi:hypothetical protein